MLRATTIGLLAFAAASVAVSIVLWQGVALTAGWDTAERLVPAANAHLVEEAWLGLYQPWRDPVFWLGVIGNAVVPIATATIVSAKLDRRAPFAVAALGLLAQASLNRDAFDSEFPAVIRAVLLVEICVVAVAGFTLAAASKMRATRSRIGA
jgi:hypothetical protein